MIQKGKSAMDFFHMVQPFSLKKLPPSPHDYPISSKSLKELVMGYDHSDDTGKDNKCTCSNCVTKTIYPDRQLLYDFLKHILVFDPQQRYTPQQALQHPFITMVNPTPTNKMTPSNTTEESEDIDIMIPMTHVKLDAPPPPAKIKSPLKSILKRPDQPSKMNTVRIQEQQSRSSSTGSSTTVALSPVQYEKDEKFQQLMSYMNQNMAQQYNEQQQLQLQQIKQYYQYQQQQQQQNRQIVSPLKSPLYKPS